MKRWHCDHSMRSLSVHTRACVLRCTAKISFLLQPPCRHLMNFPPMGTVTVIWSMSAAVSLTLGAIHLLVWFQDRRAWVNLAFFFTALGVAGMAACELGLMREGSPQRFGMILRW